MKSVLIVGGGFGGVAAAIALRKTGRVTLTLVDRKEYFEVTIAQLHALTDPGVTGKGSRIPYSEILGDSFTLGEVVELEARSVRLADGRRIEFDAVILAPGTRYPKFSIAKPLDQTTIAGRQSQNETEHEKLLGSSSFLVIGGGVVGVELAGELASYAPGKPVRLAHRGPRLTENLTEKASASALEHLGKLGVTVLLNTADARPGPGETVYSTVSPEPATEFLGSVKPGILNERKLIKVDEHLRVKGFDSWYAVGDANDVPQAKQAITAGEQGEYAARHILEGLGPKASRAKPYKLSATPALVPIGKEFGFAQLPFGILTWKPLINIKRKDFMVGMFRRKLRLKG